jgi:hypothetical protein
MSALLNRVSRLAAVAALALAAISASCSGNVVRTMVPSPIVVQDERLDFSRLVLPESRTTEVSVLFATTRAPTPPDAPERYTSRAGDAVRVGAAQVQLGEPKWSFEDLVESDRTSRPETPRPARVVAVEEFGVFGAPGSEAERQFIAAIDRQLETSPNGSVVIYVPGYRATFDQVMILMGSWGALPSATVSGDRFLLAHGHLGVELSNRLPARACVRARHRAADRAGRRA